MIKQLREAIAYLENEKATYATEKDNFCNHVKLL